MNILHFIAQWLLILMAASFVTVLVWAALCLLGDAAAGEGRKERS